MKRLLSFPLHIVWHLGPTYQNSTALKGVSVIELQLQILAFLAIGYFFGKKKLITQNAAAQLNTLVMNLILPCSIFRAFQRALTREIIESTFMVLVWAIILQVLAMIAGHYMWKKVKSPSERLNLEYGTVSNNAGTLGLVVGQAALGEIGALYTSIYAIPLRIVMWSYGLTIYARSTSVSWKDVFKKTVTNPCMIAIFLGILMMIAQSTGFVMPSLPDKIIASLAGCNTVMIMIVIGVILSEISIRDLFAPSLIWYSIVRLVLIPGIVCAGLALFHTPSIVLMVCTLESAMPAPVTMAMLSQKFHQNEAYASKMIFLSTVLSMVTLPLWTSLLAAWF